MSEFRCPACTEPITLEGLTEANRVRLPNGYTGLGFRYNCGCSEGELAASFPLRLAALRSLIGGAELPWRNPLRPSLTPDEIEREVAWWAFDLHHTKSVSDFLWWVDAYSSERSSD